MAAAIVSDIMNNVSMTSSLSKHTKDVQVIGIGAAILLALSYSFYDIYLLPPRNIRHLPHWKYSDFMRKILFKKNANYEENIRLSKDDGKTQQQEIKNIEFDGLNLKPDRIGWVLHVSSPTGVKTVLSKPDVFVKASLGSGSKKETIYHRFIGGSNILLSNGDEYKRHRKTANPAFHRSMPVQLFGQMAQKVLCEIDRLDGQNVQMTDLCMRSTLDIIGKAGFDFDFNATGDPDNEWVNVYQSIMKAMNDRLFYFLPFLDQNKWLPLFPKRQQVHQHLTKFLGMLSDMIEHKRRLIYAGNSNIIVEGTNKNESDLLSLMIESELDNNQENSLSNEEIRSNLCIFFFAGHETTSNALAFALYNLAVNPEAQAKAREEAIKYLGDAPEDVLPTTEQVMKLSYINQVMKETMRMFGPVIDTAPRITTEDTYIDEAFVPKNTFVTVNIFNLHHNEKVWKTPDQFIPERFAPGGEADQLAATDGTNWAPFGGGRRQCIGMNFSLSEQRVILSMLLRKYTWTLPEDSIHRDKVVTSGIISISPVNLHINFKRRY